MLGVDFNDDDNKARGSFDQMTDYETFEYENEARDSLEQKVDSTTILNHLFVNEAEEVEIFCIFNIVENSFYRKMVQIKSLLLTVLQVLMN